MYSRWFSAILFCLRDSNVICEASYVAKQTKKEGPSLKAPSLNDNWMLAAGTCLLKRLNRPDREQHARIKRKSEGRNDGAALCPIHPQRFAGGAFS